MKALLLENIHPEATRILTDAGFEVNNRPGALDGDELLDALAGVSVLGIRSRTQVTSDVLDRVPDSLETIGCFSIGTNQVNLASAARKGLPVFNAPYSNTRSVVELAMAEIVVLARHLTDRNREMHAGLWEKSAKGAHEVRGRTLGIVGYGNIGSQLSTLAEAFGMRVLFYDIVNKLALGNAKRCATLGELLAEAETVSLHVDGRTSNANFFGEPEFAQMRDRSLFLNLCRGFVVNHAALANHLRSGHIAGAAIDVFAEEPATAGEAFANELQNIPNVVLTPHIGGSTQEAQVNIGRFVAGKMLDYVSTGSTMMSVNLPQVQVGPRQGRRVLHIHRNVPGVMAQLNNILSAHQANIAFQSLATQGEVGYAVTDVTEAQAGLGDQLRAMDETIKVKVI